MDRDDYETMRALDVEAVIEQFLSSYNYAASTIRSYSRTLRAYVDWATEQGYHPLAVNFPEINKYFEARGTEPWTRSKHHDYTVLKSFFTYISNRWRVPSPFTHRDVFRPPDPDDNAVQVMRADHHAAIVKAALDLPANDALQVLLIAINGLKAKELLAADASDLATVGDDLVLRLPGRGPEAFTPLVGPLRALGESLLRERTSGPLLTNRAGNRINRTNVHALLGRVVKSAGVPRTNLSVLRNTAGSIALTQGLSSKGVQTMLGLGNRGSYRYLPLDTIQEDHGAVLVLRSVWHSEERNDLLASAESLVGDRQAHPIAPIVLVGAALEQHLRKLCQQAGFPDSFGSIDKYKGYLRKHNIINSKEAKKIDVWAVLRNEAAHGSSAVTREDAQEMARGVREFIESRPS